MTSIDREILGGKEKTLEEQWEAFERGDYGRTTLMAVVVSIINAGGKVEHLRDQFPDKLLDFFEKVIRENSESWQEGHESFAMTD